MDFPQPHSLKQVANLVGCDFFGDESIQLMGTNEIHSVRTGDLVFVDHPKYYIKAIESKASVVLINKKIDFPKEKGIILSDDPFRDFNLLNACFTQFQKSNQAIDPSAKIGKNVTIQPNVFVGPNVEIGDDCILHAGANINQNTKIGNRVTIHSGTSIGGDAFYYKKRPEGYDKLVSTGNVVIENDVEIGSNCTIDRGVSASTTIGAGTKIDNLVQIGHDTIIGKNCLFASQVGIAGCCIIKDNVTLWGQVGVVSGVTIGENAVVFGQSGVSKSIKGNETYLGSPATELRKQITKFFAVEKLLKKTNI